MTEPDEQRRQHQENRDLLIEIKTVVSKNFEQFSSHIVDDAKIQGKLDDSIRALHRRVDNLLVTGVLGIVVLVIAWLLKLEGKAG